MNKYCWTAFVIFIIIGCGKGKDDAPVSPVVPNVPDTLLSWTKINPGLSSDPKTYNFNDIYFTDARNGYLASDDGYLYKSADSGKNWQRITSMKITPLNISLVNTNIIFVQGLDSIGFSFDGGQTWAAKNVASAIGATRPQSLANIWFATASTGYVTTSVGMFKTTDTCKTWKYVNPAAGGAMFFFDKDNGRLNVGSNFYSTNDGANTWSTKGSVSYATPGVLANTLQYTDNSTAYLTCSSGLAKTTNDGVTWGLVLNTGTSLATQPYDISFINNLVGYTSTTKEIFKTTDGGITWSRNSKVGNDTLYEIHFIDEKTGWACGTKGLLLRLKL
jgi:photosystem II stability/assembly factor-like uncharacterized protein